jgi:hypothetical protein
MKILKKETETPEEAKKLQIVILTVEAVTKSSLTSISNFKHQKKNFHVD